LIPSLSTLDDLGNIEYISTVRQMSTGENDDDDSCVVEILCVDAWMYMYVRRQEQNELKYIYIM
jgi:hypothetical protein